MTFPESEPSAACAGVRLRPTEPPWMIALLSRWQVAGGVIGVEAAAGTGAAAIGADRAAETAIGVAKSIGTGKPLHCVPPIACASF